MIKMDKIIDWTEKLNVRLDNLVDNVNSNFYMLLVAMTFYDLGRVSIDQYADDVVISPKVGIDLHIEPIPVVNVKQFKRHFPDFLLEVFHDRLVRMWNECLNDVYSLLLQAHFDNARNLSKLKKQQIVLDCSKMPIEEDQIKVQLIEKFRFAPFSQRQALIDSELNPEKKELQALREITKNVHVRNIIQHRQGILDSYVLKEVGCTNIELRDSEGFIKKYKEGDVVALSIPEVNTFASCILLVQQMWRGE
jgi:hypothetical protein